MNKKNYSVMNIFESLGKTAISLLCEVRYKLISELNTFMLILQVAFPVILVKLNFSYAEMIISMVILMILVRYVKDFTNDLNGVTETGVPVPRQRYTYIDEKGFVGYRKNINQLDAMLYINQVEEYLDRKGWL